MTSTPTTPEPDSGKGRIVCKCLSVTEEAMRKMVKKSERGDLEAFSRRTSVGRQCGSCRGETGRILAEVAAGPERADDAGAGTLPAMHVARVWLHRVHLYFSLAACLILLFFALTGFVMNHPGAFGLDAVRSRTIAGEIPARICEMNPDSGLLLAQLRPHGIRGDVSSFEPSEDSLHLETRSLGQVAVVEVDRATGRFEATVEENGWLSALAALHRADHAGEQGGSRFVDASAILLLIVGAGGLALFLISPGVRRPLAIVTLVLGGLGFAAFLFVLW